MNLMMRTTIAMAVATALALYVFTPTVARASTDAGSPTAIVVGTGGLDNTQAEQAGDPGDTQADESGDQGNEQVDQNVEQADQVGDEQS
jgi:hypothetical protein